MFVLIVEMAQHDGAAVALVKKSNNLVAPSLELTVNKTTTIFGGKNNRKNTGCFLEIMISRN
jgi:hypothetical protein